MPEHAQPRSRTRIWLRLAQTKAWSLVNRFYEDEPSNDIEKILFHAIREILSFFLRRLKLA